MSYSIIPADCRDGMRLCLAPNSVNTCVTSPPYFGLRNYQVDGQLGLEPTPEEYIAAMVTVFREVRRVLRDDGTLWLVIGDSYTNDRKWGGSTGGKHVGALHGGTGVGRQKRNTNIKEKELIGIPWRLAFALQADGWYLRQDIIWSKPNPMPESMRDRCTKAHEYVFLLTKSPRYYFDSDAIAENAEGSFREGQPKRPNCNGAIPPRHARWGATHTGLDAATRGGTRNKRSVWTVASKAYRGAHFATFPPALIEPCILAGCPTSVCSQCGSPWTPEYDRKSMVIDRSERTHEKGRSRSSGTMVEPASSSLIGHFPTCNCRAPSEPGTVLDPFGGSGTTAMVAERLGRDSVLFELNEEYITLAHARVAAGK